MTQFLYNLNKWKRFTEGEVLHYSNPNPRKVRLEVNSAETVRFFVAEPPGTDAEFFAVVYGRDTIEFYPSGPFDLILDGGDCMLYTIDSDDWSVETVDFTSFTRIVERRQRNPELEMMMHLQAVNMEKRLAQQAEELAKQFERTLAKRDAARAASAAAAERPAGAGDGSGGTPSAEPRQNVGDAPALAPAGEGDVDDKPKPKK